MGRHLLAVALILLAQLAGLAQYGPRPREQGQPQVDHSDARLDQAVQIDIVGRALGPSLAMLSEATGVSLAVAPENQGTLGERKLVILPRGCSLRGILVQVPSALQDCHWDVIGEGPDRAYLLHLNSGMYDALDALRR